MKQLTLSAIAIALFAIQGTQSAHAQVEYVDMGLNGSCMSCEPGVPICSTCLKPDCDGKCQRLCRRLGFYGGAVADIPLDGIFNAAANTSVTAGALGIDPLVLPAATPVDLMIQESGFDDIYPYFYGYSANISIAPAFDSATKFYIGYREVHGEADEVEVGQAIIDPGGVNTTAPLLAQFDDYDEWSVQLGFMTSKSMHSKMELLWGGRGGVAMVNNIDGTFFVPGMATLADTPFYQDSTILSFGVNVGFRWNVKPNLSLMVLSGAEYRTALDEDDSVLPSLGLGNLNNGSGFTSLPIYAGFTLKL